MTPIDSSDSADSLASARGSGRDSTSQLDARIGRVLQDRYQIVSLIASGGMGVVYRAERLQLGRPVAIKFLHPAMARNADFLRRFELEAQAMGRLSHPNCVSVFDFGVDDAPYLVMDFVQGGTLRQLMDDRRISKPRAIDIARQLLAGLAHAHKQEIIHRDVKPGNVMIDEDVTGTGDHVRILDFGLAKLRDDGLSIDGSTVKLAVGTPSYMPPEQIRGLRADARSDIYSVGVLLFELLAGQKPFAAEDTIALLRMHTDQPPPSLAEVRPEETFSAALEQTVRRALDKDPQARFQSAQEFQSSLVQTPEARSSDHGPRFAFAPTLPAVPATGAALQARGVEPVPGLISGHPAGSHRSTVPGVAGRGTRPKHLSLALGVMGVLIALSSTATWLLWRQTPAPRGTPSAPARNASKPPLAPSTPPTAAIVPHLPRPDVGVPVERIGAAEGSGQSPASAPTQLPGSNSTDQDEAESASELDQAAATEVAANPDLAGGEDDQDEPADHLPQLADAAADAPRRPGARRSSRSAAGVRGAARPSKTVLAIRELRALRMRHPGNAEYPLRMGHLYCKLEYFADGMAAYLSAIKKRRQLSRSQQLIRNTVKALSSRRASSRAAALILRYIGRPARPHLLRAARQHRNPKVRARAVYLLRRLQ